MNIKKLFKIFAAVTLSTLFLTSCGGGDESPEEVIEKFKENVTEIESGDVSAELIMKGVDDEDIIDFSSDIFIKFDRHDFEDRKADVNVILGGVMQTEGQTFEGDVDFSIRSLADQYYLRLDELKVTGETLKQFEPMIEKYLDKWLLVDSNFIPEDIRQLQQKDEETLAKEEQLKQLFIKSKLFYVDREYGIETVNGEKVYHYGIKFDSDGVKEYLRKAAVIDGRALTETEVEEAAKIASYITNAELWIGVDDYFLYKGVADLTGGVVEEDVDMEINISMEGKDYNKDIDIMAPEDAENFNPLELLMAYSTVELESEDGDLNLPGGEPTEEELLEAIKAFEEAE